jgi:tRNA G10  N-methylase Trm11
MLAHVQQIGLDVDRVDACVSNLPFGQQYQVQEDMDIWLRVVLAELARVTRTGGRVVLLAPAIAWKLVPPELRLTGWCRSDCWARNKS